MVKRPPKWKSHKSNTKKILKHFGTPKSFNYKLPHSLCPLLSTDKNFHKTEVSEYFGPSSLFTYEDFLVTFSIFVTSYIKSFCVINI